MTTTAQLTDIIAQAIEKLNSYRPDDPLFFSEDMPLDPKYGQLSSLDFVYFLVGLEEGLSEKYGNTIFITDSITQAIGTEPNLLASPAHLAAYLEKTVCHEAK